MDHRIIRILLASLGPAGCLAGPELPGPAVDPGVYHETVQLDRGDTVSVQVILADETGSSDELAVLLEPDQWHPFSLRYSGATVSRPRGSYAYQVVCWSTAGLVRTDWGRIALRTDTVLDIRLSRTGCEDPFERASSVRLRGTYLAGFEQSEFRPCPVPRIVTASVPGFSPPVEIWVDWEPHIAWPEMDPHPAPVFMDTVFVEWEGKLVGPGFFGHLGGSPFLFRVERILSARRTGMKNCD